MARTLEKSKGRRTTAPFLAIPRHVIESEQWAALSHPAVRLLIDLASQFRGANNGDFTAAWSIMKLKGWKSKRVLYRAIHELLEAGFIEKTRQGARRITTLYAVTWLPINECNGKLDSGVRATITPSHLWKNKSLVPQGYQIDPTAIPKQGENNVH